MMKHHLVAPMRGERTTSHIPHISNADESPSTFEHVFDVGQRLVAQVVAQRESLGLSPLDTAEELSDCSTAASLACASSEEHQ